MAENNIKPEYQETNMKQLNKSTHWSTERIRRDLEGNKTYYLQLS